MRIFTAARHESALNGRLSRFLGYAAGEIVLIVVGILLALQISEWNTRRVHYDEARQYLARLDAELSSHQAELADQINLTAIRMESVNVLLRAVETKAEQIDLDQVYDALGRTNNIKQLSLSTSVYEESGSPGKDYLLRDPDLQNALGSYYAEIQQEKASTTSASVFNGGSFTIHLSFSILMPPECTKDGPSKLSAGSWACTWSICR